MEFLKVVIRPDGVNIEEEKMKAVLDWLAPKRVKNIQKFLELANVKIVDGGLYFIVSVHFYFTFHFFFFFSFFYF